jgi:enoyl-CoA hydratase/carnithine racemase
MMALLPGQKTTANRAEKMSESILYEQDGPVAVITLNRPERLNAMDQQMLAALVQAAARAEQDETVRAVVLTGAGRGFSSGFDLKAQAEAPPSGSAEWRPVLENDFDACMRFWHLDKPTIAAVHGPALAGAFELTMACDLTIASEEAIFGEPELRFGAGIVVMLLPWLVGPKRAKEIILLGLDQMDAATAHAMGLVNRVVPVGEHLTMACTLARQLSTIDRPLMRETKRAINEAYAIMGMHEALKWNLEADIRIEGQSMPTKRRFLSIAREEGLKAAIAWRDQQTGEKSA